MKDAKKFIWTDTHQHLFDKIKLIIKNVTENTHNNPNVNTRVKCDESREGLRAALEQETAEGWKPVSFASRFLNKAEANYSINEL